MKPTNEKITNFLEQTKQESREKYDLLEVLRSIVFDQLPEVTETFKYGGIMLSLSSEFGGLFVYEKHISFEFSFGYQIQTDLPLEGKGKYRRHLKFKHMNDIDKEGLKAILEQVKEITG